MKATESPFPAAWWTAGAALYGTPRTYGPVSHDRLPELPFAHFDGTFSWLLAYTPRMRGIDYEPWDGESGTLESFCAIEAEARSLNLRIPDAFVSFVSNAELYRRVPSGTGCYLGFSSDLVEDPAGRGGRMLRFLNDSQGTWLWYLYLAADGDSCIVSSGIWHDRFRDDPNRVVDPGQYFWSAPDIETFICRVWFEERISEHFFWHQPLPPDLAAYANAAADVPLI